MKNVTLFLLAQLFIITAWAETEPVKAEVGKHVSSNNLDASSMILSLLMVLVIIVISAIILKKFNFNQGQTSDIKIITSLHLSAKEKIVVVQVAEKQLLLGVTGQQINLLQTLEQPLDIKAPVNQQLAASIGKLLKKQS